MVIQHNVFALFASRENKAVWEKKNKSTEKLSTGYRINRAADNAAGLAISEEMRKQIRGLNRGAQNIDEGIKYCQTADGALNEVHDMLQRMNELAVQAANGPYSDSDRAAISEEVDHIKSEIDRIFTTTRYNEEYIFKTDEPEIDELIPYTLKFKGWPDNIFIYNETYDSNTGTATYGGISYKGTRYAWSSISSTMYDPNTNAFRKGTYNLQAEDGAYLTLTCENGSRPPQVSLEYTMIAGAGGIAINGETIAWKDVKDDAGKSIDKDYIEPKNYSFDFHGVKISFTPDPEDDFSNVMRKLSYTRWKSKYIMPVGEGWALGGDFSSTKAYFSSSDQVKNYLLGNSADSYSYTVRASNGTNGTFDGVWLEDRNGKTVNGSQRSWDWLGITNWGDGSTDIYKEGTEGADGTKAEKGTTCTYRCADPMGGGSTIEFSFEVLLNEISKDSAIDALDGIKLAPSKNTDKNFVHDVAISGGSARIYYETIDNITLEKLYDLGMDFSKLSHTYGSKNLTCTTTSSGIRVSVSFAGKTTMKTYSGTNLSVIDSFVNTIKASLNSSVRLSAPRYKAGSKDPTQLNLSALASMTGNGQTTKLNEVHQFVSTTTISSLKSTYATNPSESYAGASIDFSGLGKSYGLVDLVRMGFAFSCLDSGHSNSIRFVTDDMLGSPQWNSVTASDGNDYQYIDDGFTLYINLDSMDGKINDGVGFTNALVDIIKDAGVNNNYFYYNEMQYATYTDKAELYLFDKRSYLTPNASNYTSSFRPIYSTVNTTTGGFSVTLYDMDNRNEYVDIQYGGYDFSSKIPLSYNHDYLKFTFTTTTVSNGAYVKNADGKPELYDAAKHSGQDRYDITDVQLNVNDAKLDADLRAYVGGLIKSSIQNTEMSLTGYNKPYSVNADVNDNYAMVTNYNTPYQIKPPNSNGFFSDFLNIQCSSNARDFIRIQKQKLSVKRLGLTKVSVDTAAKATKAITLLDGILAKISKSRSTIGAYQNRLEHAYAINQNTAENTQYAESKIRDTDMAEEMVQYSNASILSQAGLSMLAQANQMNQAVLNLLG